jgi:hypothetical protein
MTTASFREDGLYGFSCKPSTSPCPAALPHSRLTTSFLIVHLHWHVHSEHSMQLNKGLNSRPSIVDSAQQVKAAGKSTNSFLIRLYLPYLFFSLNKYDPKSTLISYKYYVLLKFKPIVSPGQCYIQMAQAHY